MFLAWKEIKYSKLRFSLIIGVVALVAWLVFLLSSLAFGLASVNRLAIDQFDANAIALTDESDLSLTQSKLLIKDAKTVQGNQTAFLGQSSGVVTAKNLDGKVSVSILGMDDDSFIMPKVVEGKAFANEGEVLADISMKKKGTEIGDELNISSSDKKLKVVGFVENGKYGTLPVLYMSIPDWQELKFGTSDTSDNGLVSAVIIRDKEALDQTPASTVKISKITDFIEKIPGYSAQNLTFNIMIGFLFIITAFVIGIFIYVLTMQKTATFGVLKAQGMTTGFLSKMVISQTFILATIGVLIGLGLTFITAAFLPDAAPFMINDLNLAIYSVVLVAVAVIGALFSVASIAKIDPLKAIGGE